MNATATLGRPFAVVIDEFLPQPSEERPPAFAFESVTKAFGANIVLDGIDLEVAQGEFVAVVGKSGCGKSTLLRLLAGLDRPTSGAIRLSDRTGGGTETRVMFQEARLLPWARVAENVYIGLTGLAKGAEAQSRVSAILREVGLERRAGDWPSVLSGGQKSRVALARALVGNPQILALDEPLGALDALTRIEMQALLERIWLAQKFTAVLVTHDVAEAVALADRALVIEAGRITLDLPITLPRPRRHGSVEAAKLEGIILDRLFGRS